MRTSAITATTVALALFATALRAEDDFSALLADLSFADFPSLNEPLSVAESNTAEKLQPVPSGIMMPGKVERTPQPKVETEVAETPQVALKDPIPVHQPTAKKDEVNFDAAFALQDPPVKASTVSHTHNYCDANGCQDAITCRPRNQVVLPSSTLLQYFRSNTCYTNVWDGYRQHCGPHHKHLHGECDCFNKSSKHCGSSCESCDACCD